MDACCVNKLLFMFVLYILCCLSLQCFIISNITFLIVTCYLFLWFIVFEKLVIAYVVSDSIKSDVFHILKVTFGAAEGSESVRTRNKICTWA
jgi:hypothetical protein